MEAKWRRLTDLLVVPAKLFILNHTIVRDNISHDDDEVNTFFNSTDQTIIIEREFPALEEATIAIEKYATSNDLTYETQFTNDSVLIFKPFNIVFAKKGGILTNKVSRCTCVYFKSGKEIGKLTITSFQELMNLEFWKTGYDVKFLLQCKVIIDDASKRLVTYLTCEEIFFIQT